MNDSRQCTDGNTVAELLLRHMAAADTSAAAELYDLYSNILMGQAMQITRDPVIAEDVLQEAFINIYRYANQWDAHLGKPISWMIAIARNKACDHLGRRRRQHEIVTNLKANDAIIGAEEVDGREAAIRSETYHAIRRGREQLAKEQRESIQLVFLRTMSQSEAAKHLEEPLGTVEARIRRGLFALRETLRSYHRACRCLACRVPMLKLAGPDILPSSTFGTLAALSPNTMKTLLLSLFLSVPPLAGLSGHRGAVSELNPNTKEGGIFDVFAGDGRISKIFDWCAKDFEKAGGLRGILARYGRGKHRDMLRRDSYDICYLSYDWSLNARN